jgi:histidinol-phosphate/aromatic aminotransferase/cobyric acid decarboxylase-like protein
VLAYFGSYHQAFVEQMRLRGILVRDRDTDSGCAGCVRITLGNRLQTARLLRELPAALSSIGFTLQLLPNLAVKEAQ